MFGSYDNAIAAVRVLLRSFFRRIEVTGLAHVPPSGGGLFVAFHPNGLIDPALIATSCPRPIVFGARHGLFAWPLVGQLLRAVGTVPIYREMRSSDRVSMARGALLRRSSVCTAC